MKKKRAADGILEGLMQARDHAKGIHRDVRLSRVKVEPLQEADGRCMDKVRKDPKLLQK